MEKKRKEKMISMLLNYGILLLIVAVMVYFNANRTDGWEEVKKGLWSGGKQLLHFTPLLVIIFIAMGQADVAIKRHDAEIKEGMSGGKGLPASFLAGMFSPGSISGLKPAREMWENEDGKYSKSAIYVFLIASMLVNLQTTLMRGAFMGWKLTAITYGTCFFIALLLLSCVWIYEKVFG